MPHPGLAAAVQPLQALDQKFNIADAAARQLDIETGAGAFRRQFFVDAGACLRDRFYGTEVESG